LLSWDDWLRCATGNAFAVNAKESAVGRELEPTWLADAGVLIERRWRATRP
jgi:hypothetical protein